MSLLNQAKAELKSREETIQSLFNRLQSGDLRTFQSLVPTPLPQMEQTYIPRTDEHELQVLGAAEGIGQGIFDDGSAELSDTFSEFGIDITT